MVRFSDNWKSVAEKAFPLQDPENPRPFVHPAMAQRVVNVIGQNASAMGMPRVALWHWSLGKQTGCDRKVPKSFHQPVEHTYELTDPSLNRVKRLLCCLCRDALIEQATGIADQHGFAFQQEDLCVLVDELLDGNVLATASDVTLILSAIRLLDFK